MPETTPDTRCRVLGWSGSPKRSAFIMAMGRAPMVKTSRMMPPTPVGRALIRLDKAGMIVAFHLEDGGVAIADIDHPGILARALDHPGRLGGQLLQMGAGGFVGAMLA